MALPGKPPTPADFVGKAEANKKFGLAMISTHPTSAGWALTALFYSAVHFSEAYFLKISKRIDNHIERFDAIKNDPLLKGIYGRYMHLYDYSYNARYTLRVHGKSDVDKAKPSLEAVEQHFKSLL